MSDLDDRLAGLRRTPAPPLAPVQDVVARGDQRRRTGRIVSATAAVLLVAGAGGIVYGLSSPGSGRDDVLTPARPSPSGVTATTPAPVPSPTASPSTTRPPAAPTQRPSASPAATPSDRRGNTPAAPVGLDSDDRLELTGIGGLRIGQTYAEAAAATGRKIMIDDALGNGGSCVYGSIAGVPDVNLLGGDGVVQRIDVVDPGRLTASGVGIGDTEARVLEVYTSAETRPHEYDEDGHYLVVRPAGSAYQLLFETDGSVVTTFRTGTVGFVDAPEGCA